jgi:hypothetical protein
MVFNFALEYVIKKAEKNKMGPKLNGTHKLLSYYDNITLLEDNINITKKTHKLYLMLVWRLGIQIDVEKNICCYLVANAEQNYINIENGSLLKCVAFQIFGKSKKLKFDSRGN